MQEEIMTVVKIPISYIEQTVRANHVLPKLLVEARIDEGTLVLSFSDEPKAEENLDPSDGASRKRRRAHRKRNRMKTRGWEIVARITNSKGQKCSIYKPFVDALDRPNLTVEEQKAAVIKILRSNRNKPSEESVRYFLENTIEYLRSQVHIPSQ